MSWAELPYLPKGQKPEQVDEDRPVDDPNVPIGHGEHDAVVAPLMENVPRLHEPDPAAEEVPCKQYKPGGQRFVQLAETSAPKPYVPALHKPEQSLVVNPSLAPYLPAVQSIHDP